MGRTRSGQVIVYLAIAIPVVAGFCAFAVDFGRVQLAKSQLQTGATAAARAGVANVFSGVNSAQSAAVTMAGNNTCDGVGIAIDVNNDIDFLAWNDTNATFTVLTGAARSGAYAIRVTARRTVARGNPIHLNLARAIGLNDFDVTASAIAKLSPVFPFVGMDSITFSGQGNTDSFDASLGAYSPATARRNGSIATNGDIQLGGNSVVKGDAHPGIGGLLNISGTSSVSGLRTPLTVKLAYGTPQVPAGTLNAGAVNVGSGTFYVNAGDYSCTSLTISNKATFYCQGVVRVFCSGPVNISGGYIHTYQNRPTNFQLHVTTASPVTLNGQADFYGQIYAPLSDVTQGGQADIYGSIIGKTLNFGGTWQGGAHADESAGFIGRPVIVTTR